jgi:hypothetical protein
MSYTPKPGSLTARMVDLVHRVAPYGGPVWVGTASLARECGIAGSSVVTTMDQTPSKHGLVVRRRHSVHGVQYQAGPNSPQTDSSGQPETEKEPDPMLQPHQRTVPAANAERAVSPMAVSSIFALAAGMKDLPAMAEPEEQWKPVADLIAPVPTLSDWVRSAKTRTPADAEVSAPDEGTQVEAAVFVADDKTSGFAVYGSPAPQEFVGTTKIARDPPVKVLLHSDRMPAAKPEVGSPPFACALFNDGRLLIEEGGHHRVMPREHVQVLVAYLATVAAAERVAAVEQEAA